MPGQELIPDHGYGVLIRTPVNEPTLALLRCHVLRSSDHRTCLGELRTPYKRLRNTEVGEMNLLVDIEQNVCRLDVPVNHAAFMGVSQTRRGFQ